MCVHSVLRHQLESNGTVRDEKSQKMHMRLRYVY